MNFSIPNQCFSNLWNYPFFPQNFLLNPMLPFACGNPANYLIPNSFGMNNLYGALQLPMYPYNQQIIPVDNVNHVNSIKKTSNNIIIVD